MATPFERRLNARIHQELRQGLAAEQLRTLMERLNPPEDDADLAPLLGEDGPPDLGQFPQPDLEHGQRVAQRNTQVYNRRTRAQIEARGEGEAFEEYAERDGSSALMAALGELETATTPVFDLLSLGQYGHAGFWQEYVRTGSARQALAQAGEEIANALPYVEREGARRPSFADVLRELDEEHDLPLISPDGSGRWANAGMGFVMDVLLDPTTYMGIGVVGRGLKYLGQGVKVAARTRTGAEVLETVAKIPGAEELAHHMAGTAAWLTRHLRADGELKALQRSGKTFEGDEALDAIVEGGASGLEGGGKEAVARSLAYREQANQLGTQIKQEVNTEILGLRSGTSEYERLLLGAVMSEKHDGMITAAIEETFKQGLFPEGITLSMVMKKKDDFREVVQRWADDEVVRDIMDEKILGHNYLFGLGPQTTRAKRLWSDTIHALGIKPRTNVDPLEDGLAYLLKSEFGLSPDFTKAKTHLTHGERTRAAVPTAFDIGQLTLARGYAYAKAVMSRTWVDGVANDPSISRRILPGALTKELRDHATEKGYSVFSYRVGKAEQQYLMPTEIVNTLTQMRKFAPERDEFRSLIAGYDWFQNTWKGWAVLSTGFHARNMYSNWYQNWMAGVGNMDDLGEYEGVFTTKNVPFRNMPRTFKNLGHAVFGGGKGGQRQAGLVWLSVLSLRTQLGNLGELHPTIQKTLTDMLQRGSIDEAGVEALRSNLDKLSTGAQRGAEKVYKGLERLIGQDMTLPDITVAGRKIESFDELYALAESRGVVGGGFFDGDLTREMELEAFRSVEAKWYGGIVDFIQGGRGRRDLPGINPEAISKLEARNVADFNQTGLTQAQWRKARDLAVQEGDDEAAAQFTHLMNRYKGERGPSDPTGRLEFSRLDNRQARDFMLGGRPARTVAGRDEIVGRFDTDARRIGAEPTANTRVSPTQRGTAQGQAQRAGQRVTDELTPVRPESLRWPKGMKLPDEDGGLVDVGGQLVSQMEMDALTELTRATALASTSSKGVLADKTKHMLGPQSALMKMNRGMGALMEDNARLSHFIDRLMKGASPDEAAASTKKWLFDYNELTDFERRYMKRFIPFYTWMRKNIPLQMEAVLKNPGRYAKIPKTFNAIEQLSHDWEGIPTRDYFQELNAVRLPYADDKGDPVYYNPNFPFQDLNRLNGQDLISSLAPIPKLLIEAISNKNFFLDRPIEQFPGEPVEALTGLPNWMNRRQNVHVVTSLAPLAGKALRYFDSELKGNEGKQALAEFAGFKFIGNNPHSNIRRQDYKTREQLEAYERVGKRFDQYHRRAARRAKE